MIDVKDIPGGKTDYDVYLTIKFPVSATSVPPVYNELTTEVTGWIVITDNKQLKHIEKFDNLVSIGGSLLIRDNVELNTITGFGKLKNIGSHLSLKNNPNLIAMSIPSTLINSVNWKKYNIQVDYRFIFISPEEFVNIDYVIQDCIRKFNPELHGDIVVTQILENLELWGTDETKDIVLRHLCSKGANPDLIPAEYLNKYHTGTIQKNNKILNDYLEM